MQKLEQKGLRGPKLGCAAGRTPDPFGEPASAHVLLSVGRLIVPYGPNRTDADRLMGWPAGDALR
jgi:hypothetical protein